MALTEKQKKFIEDVAGYVREFAGQYGIKVHSPIIAQAILESGWGKSTLAAKYHNYFGMKCGSKWTGKSVNMTTQEEYTPGTKTTIKDNFRVYGSMKEGIKGYFEFIQLARYQNLKGITDPKKYLQTIKDDGYATSSTYVKDVYACVTTYGLTKYDGAVMTEAELRKSVVDWMKQYLGIKEGSAEHKAILAVFNDSGLCKRYKMTVNDSWCATTVSAAFIAAGLAGIFPCVECSCGNMVKLAIDAGIWQENDAYVPNTGDPILYDWDDTGKGDNTGWPDHIGIVVSVSNGVIKVIEGNKADTVGYREIAVNAKNIRGFITPKFASVSKPSSGGGNKDASPAKPSTGGSSAPSYTVGKTYTVQTELNVRKGPGTSYAKVGHSGLTASGKANDKDKDGALDKGTRVTCKAVKKDGKNVWMQIPSGWIAAYYDGKTYVK